MIKKKYLYLIFFLILNFFNQHLKADEMFELGKNIFLNKAYCASCHTLADAGSVGNIGPNLNEIKPEYKLIDDLGVDSFDTLEIIIALEKEFETEITDEDASKFKSVNDVLNYFIVDSR